MLVAANMTKADEAELLADFIGSLPQSCYLSDYMQGWGSVHIKKRCPQTATKSSRSG